MKKLPKYLIEAEARKEFKETKRLYNKELKKYDEIFLSLLREKIKEILKGEKAEEKYAKSLEKQK